MSKWHGFEKAEFLFEGRRAILVLPKESNKTDKWLLKTEYWDIFSEMEVEMLRLGWHVAYIENKTRWCLDEDLDMKKLRRNVCYKICGALSSICVSSVCRCACN